MAPLIPPLDFSRCSDSFTTAAESPSLCHAKSNWDDSDSDSDSESLWSNYSADSAPQMAVPVRVPHAPAPGMAPQAAIPVAGTQPQPPVPVHVLKEHEVMGAVIGRRATVSSQRKKPVKRKKAAVEGSQQVVKHRQPVKVSTPAAASEGTEHGATSYRCDIHTTSNGPTNFATAEAECKRLVIEAGGRVIDDFAYPGGFLYQLPRATSNPLQDGCPTQSGGAYINVTPWTPFPAALFNGLKLTPYGGEGEFLLLPIPPHQRAKMLPNLEKALLRSGDDVGRKRVSVWLGGMARNYGRGVSYLA